MAVRQPDETGRIVRNPRLLGGEPIIRGTRIPVRSVILAVREYGGPHGAIDAYPQLTSADVSEALAFHKAHTSLVSGNSGDLGVS